MGAALLKAPAIARELIETLSRNLTIPGERATRREELIPFPSRPSHIHLPSPFHALTNGLF